jgi:hypothetical protein
MVSTSRVDHFVYAATGAHELFYHQSDTGLLVFDTVEFANNDDACIIAIHSDSEGTRVIAVRHCIGLSASDADESVLQGCEHIESSVYPQ